METSMLVLHGLAVRKAGTAEQVAAILGIDVTFVRQTLDEAVIVEEVVGANGMYMLSTVGRARLDDAYPTVYAEVRVDDNFLTAADRFEVVNTKLLDLLTRWQTIRQAGTTVPNEHIDLSYDTKIINELGELHDKSELVLNRLSVKLPRYKAYASRLAASYDKVLAGEIDFVSGVRVDSYHLVWHELHEDLLRVCGRIRQE